MKHFFKYTLISLASLSPLAVYAQFNEGHIVKVGETITSVNQNIIGALATLVMALAVLGFFWGMVQFILASRQGEGEGVKKGRSFMLWSILALFVMFSIYGIIRFAQGTLLPGQNNETIILPSFQIKGAKGSSSGTGVGSPLTGGCTPNTRCTGCNHTSCICSDIGTCMPDYTGTGGGSGLESGCKASGGTWQSGDDGGCECPSDSYYDYNLMKCQGLY
jgi:hypothetical protein